MTVAGCHDGLRGGVDRACCSEVLKRTEEEEEDEGEDREQAEE